MLIELLEISTIFAFKIVVILALDVLTFVLLIVCDTLRFPDISAVTIFVAVPMPRLPPSNTFRHVTSSSFISIIASFPFWFIVNAGPVPSFVIFNCSEFAMFVFIILQKRRYSQ